MGSDITRLNDGCCNKSPAEILAFAISQFERIAISFSGAEDVILIDMVAKINANINVFSLDTGRLHPETYQFIETVRKHYDIKIDVISPDGEQLMKFVRKKGLYSFYQDGHQECCGIRKVIPLRRFLSSFGAWITGQRRDQSPDTRQHIPVVQEDNSLAANGKRLIKFNPLAHWTSMQVWQYIRDNEVPFNPLHARGFSSIGCEPCTRPILPHQHEREGRWWWEASAEKECGLHSDKIKQ